MKRTSVWTVLAVVGMGIVTGCSRGPASPPTQAAAAPATGGMQDQAMMTEATPPDGMMMDAKMSDGMMKRDKAMMGEEKMADPGMAADKKLPGDKMMAKDAGK